MINRSLLALALAALTPLQAAAAALEAAPELLPVSRAFAPETLRLPALEMTPTLGLVSLPVSLNAAEIPAAASMEATAAMTQSAAAIQTATAQTASASRTALSALTETMTPSHESASAAPLESRVETLYEHSSVRREGTNELPVAAAETKTKPAALSRPRPVSKLSRRWLPAAAAALAFLAPTAAFAQSAAGPVTISVASSLSWLAGIHPLVTAGGAIVGALFGLIAARSKGGAEVSAGDTLASILRYGVLGGAGAYVLLDLTQLAFIGPSIGLKPLSAAVATAAFGRSAFQGKFAETATTSADRIVGAFPAVAAALGLTIGINMMAAPVALSFQAATAAMAVTGVATALYAALYKTGRSPADGPSLMGKGYVLQSLMSGMALAVTGWLVWPFALMGLAGFGLVLFAFARELRAVVTELRSKP